MPTIIETPVGGGGLVSGGAMKANLALTGWAATAVVEDDTLTGATPDEFDGVPKATVIDHLAPPANIVKTILIPDGSQSLFGIYDITSIDASTMVLTRVLDLSDKDAVVALDQGNLGQGGGSWHFNSSLTYATKRLGGYDQLAGRHPSLPARITTSMIYFEDQPGTLSADGKTLTLTDPITAYDGFDPAANYYVTLARQGGAVEHVQNGLWNVVTTSVLARLSWFDDIYEMKANHELIVVRGHRWRNSVWRAVSGSHINPASTPVRFERLAAPNADDRSCCIYYFDDTPGATVYNKSVFTGSGRMDGTLTGASPETWWNTGGPREHYLTIPAGGYVQIANHETFRIDTNDHLLDFWFKSATADVHRFLERSDGDGSWESSERYFYMGSNGEIGLAMFGVGDFALSPGKSYNDDVWHHAQIFAMLVPDSSDVIYTLFVDNEKAGSVLASSVSSSNKNHLLRIGHSASTDAFSIAEFKLQNVGRR